MRRSHIFLVVMVCLVFSSSLSHYSWAEEAIPDSLEARVNRGDANAMMELARMYEAGNGVKPDRVEAYKWYALAAQTFIKGRDQQAGESYATAVNNRTRVGVNLSQADRNKADAEIDSTKWTTVPEATAAAKEDSADDRIDADSKISAVIVYSDRAEITRTAEVELPAGAHVVAFKGLPGILVPDSLRAEGSAVGKVTLGAVSGKEFIEKKPVVPAERSETEALKKLQAEFTGIEADKTALNARKDMLEKLIAQSGAQYSRNFAEANTDPAAWVAASQVLHDKLADIAVAFARDEMRERDVSRDIAETQNKLNQVATGARSTHGVTVPVEAEQATRLTITLKYQVPNVGWKPVYEARLDTAAAKDGVALSQYGIVWQRTGEDWQGVSLTLSTAQPQLNAALPELQPRWLDIYEKPKDESRDLSSEEYQRQLIQNTTGPGAAIPVKDASAQAKATGFVSEYTIKQPSDVPSDGTRTKLPMGKFESESKLQDYVRPQLGEESFFVARIKLKGDVSALPGDVDLFRDEAYIGNMPMPLLRPGEESDLYFGIDDQVVVTRKTLKNERKEAGVIASDNILERAYVTELQNLHKNPVDLVIRETVPVSRNEKLKIDLLKEGPTTPGFREDSDHVKGQLAWQFPLQPHEKKTIALGWTLSWPSGYLLQGLPN